MNDITAMRPAVPDWSTVTAEELIAYRDAENRVRASTAARVITGEPDPGATISWQQVALPGRELPVRVYRPLAAGALPLVIHVHGGAFVGTAAQCDWVNSHLAAHLPAVVISVEHRLLDWETPLSAAADDGWDVLRHVVEHAGTWDIDPARVAVFGESGGGLVSALAAIRAKRAGLGLRAQVLVNPAVDVTSTAWTYDSTTQYADTPTLSVALLRFFQRLAIPEGADARALSPLYADDLNGLAPALVVVPTADPIADHGRRYAERLQAAGTPTRLSEYPEAGHGFLSMPGMAPEATPARAEIIAFLRECLSE
ncbi:alpha/beta hydrolase [Allorhizocola rhizosphaerae]|uniref:alpha/beta hydrolase n=1 Tax=Allorhizocola rhizosphaerae TaxID=1872709 RepID=UPI000E3D1E99|nr:alpha/beta hydrolase [Allorhizocola rhizosphaerae]